MERLTNKEIQEQMERFDSLMTTINLVKVGKVVCNSFSSNDSYNRFNYIGRVLSMYGVKRSMYHPVKNLFYGEILEIEALSVFLNSIKVK